MGTHDAIRVWSVCRWPSAGGCIPHRRTSTPGRTVDDTVVYRSDTRHQRRATGRWRIGGAWTAFLVAAEDSVCVLLLSACLMSYFKFVKSGTLMPGCSCRRSCVQMLDCRAAGLHLLPCQQIMVLDQLDWSSHSSVMVLWNYRILTVFYFL